jgi:hypothetical protein
MSALINNGIRIPVEALAPKTKAIAATKTEEIPLIPALEMPKSMAAPAAIQKFSNIVLKYQTIIQKDKVVVQGIRIIFAFLPKPFNL